MKVCCKYKNKTAFSCGFHVWAEENPATFVQKRHNYESMYLESRKRCRVIEERFLCPFYDRKLQSSYRGQRNLFQTFTIA